MSANVSKLKSCYKKLRLLGGEWTQSLFTIQRRNFKLAYVKQSVEGLRHCCLLPGLGRVDAPHQSVSNCRVNMCL